MTTTTTRTPHTEAPDTMSNDPNSIERFRTVYSAHHDDLWRYCLRRTRSAAEAEDVLSDVFTVAWRRLPDIPDEPDTRLWLFGVARNQLRNTWRKTARSRELHLQLVSDAEVAGASPEGFTHDDPSSDIVRAINALSESDAELLRLLAWEQLPHREMATILDCTENAVSIRIHRARQRLTEQLETIRNMTTNAVPATSTAPDTHEGDHS